MKEERLCFLFNTYNITFICTDENKLLIKIKKKYVALYYRPGISLLSNQYLKYNILVLDERKMTKIGFRNKHKSCVLAEAHLSRNHTPVRKTTDPYSSVCITNTNSHNYPCPRDLTPSGKG